jgi:hypothetical protein
MWGVRSTGYVTAPVPALPSRDPSAPPRLVFSFYSYAGMRQSLGTQMIYGMLYQPRMVEEKHEEFRNENW